MLRNADPSYFNGIYRLWIYHTDLRYGIDSLSATIKQRYKMSLFVPNTLFLFCGHSYYNVYIKIIHVALPEFSFSGRKTYHPLRLAAFKKS